MKKKKPLKKYQATNSEVGTRNPDYLKGEREKGRQWSPYSVNTQANEVRTPIKESFTKQGYGPKMAWEYVDPGELSRQDSLDINANRAPTVRNFQIVAEGMKNGVQFPGLTPEFKKGMGTYMKLPEKFKQKGGPMSTSMDKVQAYYKGKKK